jgi:hypothetical protein
MPFGKIPRPFFERIAGSGKFSEVDRLSALRPTKRTGAGEMNQRFNTGDNWRMKFSGSIEVVGVKKIL